MYNVIVNLPISQGEPRTEDDAMFSKKPLGGFSCASCDKKITNLHKCASAEHMTWNQMPNSQRQDKINKIGLNFSKIISNARKADGSSQTAYQKRMGKLGEISESMTQYNKSMHQQPQSPQQQQQHQETNVDMSEIKKQ